MDLAEHLRDMFYYDSDTGLFTRLKTTSSNAIAGMIAGGVRPDGYVYIQFAGRRYYAHRLAWLYVHGHFPVGEIDHVDGDPSNNRLNNLRDVSKSVNQQNLKRAKSHNPHKLLGVRFDKRTSKNPWVTRIVTNKKVVHLGCFSSAEEAHQAYLTAKRQHHEGNTL